MSNEYLAHSKNDYGIEQPLTEHLAAVARISGEFAAAFDSAAVAERIGWLHDLGKASPAFQAYLRSEGPSIDHKAAGALFARDEQARGGDLLAPMVIQAHHGGLPTLEKHREWMRRMDHENRRIDTDIVRRIAPTFFADSIESCPIEDVHATALRARMLLSALVDADRLDTEAHFDAATGRSRSRSIPSMAVLASRIDSTVADLSKIAPAGDVADVRREVAEACRLAATRSPGLFRLTVPTGGGKTLASALFGLTHAAHHDLRRLVVAVPFITVTEQTAGALRSALGPDTVLEHHSATSDDETTVWARLATENWDASVIVTTTVRLLESLFAASTSGLRRLHRLARSVIVIDEAQTIPRDLAAPTMRALTMLCDHYGASVVLCTATQPAFDHLPEFADAEIREIAPDPATTFRRLKRVDYDYVSGTDATWDALADRIADAHSALAIVNTRRDARALYEAVREKDPTCLHLSTLMTRTHRQTTLTEIRRRLDAEETCRVVSTQLVEAGVDLDFPLVIRVLAPLDSLVQAAGRCNREGRRKRGLVIVADTPDAGSPGGSYRQAIDVARNMAPVDLDDPKTMRQWFTRLLALSQERVDGRGHTVSELDARLDFPAVASTYRLIEDDTVDVFVVDDAAGEVAQATRALSLWERQNIAEALPRWVARLAAPFAVTLHRTEAERHAADGRAKPLAGGTFRWLGEYDPQTGLDIDIAVSTSSALFA